MRSMQVKTYVVVDFTIMESTMNFTIQVEWL